MNYFLSDVFHLLIKMKNFLQQKILVIFRADNMKITFISFNKCFRSFQLIHFMVLVGFRVLAYQVTQQKNRLSVFIHKVLDFSHLSKWFQEKTLLFQMLNLASLGSFVITSKRYIESTNVIDISLVDSLLKKSKPSID